MIFLLCFILLALCITSYKLANNDILVPPVLFCGSFLFSALFAIPSIDIWNFDMSITTFEILVLGNVSFVVLFFIVFFKQKERVLSTINNNTIKFRGNRYIYLIMLQVVSLACTYSFLNAIPYGDGITEKIFIYRMAAISTNSTIDSSLIMPRYVNMLYWFTYVGGMLMLYKQVHDYIIAKRLNYICLCSSVLCFISTFLTGSRGEAIYLVLYAVIVYNILNRRKCKWVRYEITIAKICNAIITICIGLLLFVFSLILMGRDGSANDDVFDLIKGIPEYLSMYIGAPLKLLDYFIVYEYTPINDMPIGFYTFKELYRILAEKLDILEWQGMLDPGFRFVNQYFLGNVYTTFRPYYEDLGLFGVILFSGIMGAFLAWIYHSVKYNNGSSKFYNIDVMLVVYGFICYSIVLPFFFNWFYNLFIPRYMEYFLFVYFHRWFLFEKQSGAYIDNA